MAPDARNSAAKDVLARPTSPKGADSRAAPRGSAGVRGNPAWSAPEGRPHTRALLPGL